jgi:hypothetical protein
MLVVSLMFSACGHHDDSSSSDPSAVARVEKPPKKGMTKDEIVALYGKTGDMRATDSGGETWTYCLNYGDRFIPFNFGYRPKLRIINFNSKGRVTSWSYVQ